MGQLEGRTQLWWEVRVRRGGVSVKLTNPQRTYTPRRLAKLYQIAAVWCTGQFRAPNLERLPLPLNSFEFPRPFEAFEGACFLNNASGEMASNTFLGKRQRVFEVFEGGRVFAKTVVNYTLWATLN